MKVDGWWCHRGSPQHAHFLRSDLASVALLLSDLNGLRVVFVSADRDHV